MLTGSSQRSGRWDYLWPHYFPFEPFLRLNVRQEATNTTMKNKNTTNIKYKIQTHTRRQRRGGEDRRQYNTNKRMKQPGWQKLCGGTGGPCQKVWTRTKILSPNIRYFVAKQDFSRFTPFLEIFWQNQCFLGKKCTITWYILHILLS